MPELSGRILFVGSRTLCSTHPRRIVRRNSQARCLRLENMRLLESRDILLKRLDPADIAEACSLGVQVEHSRWGRIFAIRFPTRRIGHMGGAVECMRP